MAGNFETFAALHVPGNPVILYNIWDVGSALAVVAAGAKALATGSHPVADANGWPDGQQVPIDFALANAKRIVDAVEVPLTVDFEGAYSADPEEGGANVARLAATGAVGCNFEDQVIGGEGLHPLDLQVKRIAAIRKAVGDAFFINARTDAFLKTQTYDDALVDEVVKRGKAFADAGASGFFVPRLADTKADRAHRPRGAAAPERHRFPRRSGQEGLGRRRRGADQPRPLPAPGADEDTRGNGAGGDRLTNPVITAFATSPDRGRGLARDMSVRWALEEVGQPYDVELVTFKEMKEPAHRARHPFGQIPTYEEGDLTLFESGAIVLHIAERSCGPASRGCRWTGARDRLDVRRADHGAGTDRRARSRDPD